MQGLGWLKVKFGILFSKLGLGWPVAGFGHVYRRGQRSSGQATSLACSVQGETRGDYAMRIRGVCNALLGFM